MRKVFIPTLVFLYQRVLRNASVNKGAGKAYIPETKKWILFSKSKGIVQYNLLVIILHSS